MAFDIGPYFAGARYAVTTATAFGAGIGLHSIYGVSTDQVTAGFDHIFNGLNEIAVGAGILAPIVAGAWGVASSRFSSKVADVRAAAPADLASAVAKAAPTVILDAAANVPGTTQIRTTPELARATESPKVVAAPLTANPRVA
jgi:hypothetical protein